MTDVLQHHFSGASITSESIFLYCNVHAMSKILIAGNNPLMSLFCSMAVVFKSPFCSVPSLLYLACSFFLSLFFIFASSSSCCVAASAQSVGDVPSN
jgi:hypothetical protein